MDITELRRSYHEQLAQQISCQPIERAKIEPLNISRPLAVSALQKAIRRGDEGTSCRAGATLLAQAPDRFWRRCVVIAAEEIGTANPEVVALVTTAVSSGRSWRSTLGDESALAYFIASLMARSAKCRAADDLAVVAAYHPSLAHDRCALAPAPVDDLLKLAISEAFLPRRALALWYALGTNNNPPGDLQRRRGMPTFTFDYLRQTELPYSMVEIGSDGYRATKESICAFVPLLWHEQKDAQVLLEDDAFPPTGLCDPQSWARDGFTPEGRRALAAFLQTSYDSARWVRAQIPPLERAAFLAGVLFRVESGLVRKRLQWPLAAELRRMADIGCHGPHCADATEILALLRADIPLLNEVRAHVG